MTNRVIVEALGVREVDRALRLILPDMERGRVILRALHDGARPITEEARRRAPVLQDNGTLRVQSRGGSKPYYGTSNRVRGALRSGITQHTDRNNYSTVRVRVRNRGYIFGPGARNSDLAKAGNANYWWLVHFGTSKMKGNPFLYDAFEAKKHEALQKIQVSMLRGLFAVGRQLGFDVRSWADAA